MLSWLDRRSTANIERSRRETLRAMADAGRWYAQSALEALGALLVGERTIDTRTVARMWNVLADWLILGGVLAVPVAAICAAIGAVMPGSTPFHRHTGGIFALAILWFVAALLATQFQRQRMNDRASE